MIFWIVFLTIIFILGIIFMYKKRYIGCLFCFIATGELGQFIPCFYSIFIDKGLTAIETITLNNFYGICKCFMFIGYMGVLISMFISLVISISEHLRKEKKEIQDSLDQINKKVTELQSERSKTMIPVKSGVGRKVRMKELLANLPEDAKIVYFNTNEESFLIKKDNRYGSHVVSLISLL